MRAEAKLVIDYFQQYLAFVGAIRALPKAERIHFMKRNLYLDEDTELTHVQRDLFYTAISNVEWDIVVTNIEEPPEE